MDAEQRARTKQRVSYNNRRLWQYHTMGHQSPDRLLTVFQHFNTYNFPDGVIDISYAQSCCCVLTDEAVNYNSPGAWSETSSPTTLMVGTGLLGGRPVHIATVPGLTRLLSETLDRASIPRLSPVQLPIPLLYSRACFYPQKTSCQLLLRNNVMERKSRFPGREKPRPRNDTLGLGFSTSKLHTYYENGLSSVSRLHKNSSLCCRFSILFNNGTARLYAV